MLSERQLDGLLDRFQQRYRDIEDEYLRRMGEHIRDIGTLHPSDVRRLTEMKRMRANLREVRRKVAGAAGISVRELDQVFRAVAASDERFARAYFGSDQEAPVKGSGRLEKLIKAQLRQTAQAFENLSSTTVDSDAYRNAIDRGISTVAAGVEDYGAAMRRALREAGAEGLRVKYASGATRRLDTAARMNLLDGVRRLNQDCMTQLGKEFGADGVEIDAHMLCAEDHLPYQGGQYSNEEFQQIQDGLQRPFGEWNCRHTWHPILMGISPPAYTGEQLEEMRRFSTGEVEIDGRTKTRYQWSQEMRRMETAIRREKDTANLAKAAGDEKLRRECQGKIVGMNEAYGELAEKAGLKAEWQRTGVRGFRDAKTETLSSPGAADAGRNTFTPVFYDPRATYAINLPGYSSVVNEGLSSAMKDLAIKGNETGHEHMYLVNLRTGRRDFYETNENPGSVGYRFRKYLREHKNELFAFVHNHNTDGSLSETDMQTLLTEEQIPLMIAVRNDGVIYPAERKGPILTSVNFDVLYAEDLSDLRDQLKAGTITMAQRTKQREKIIVDNLLRDYTKGGQLIEYDTRPKQ